MLDLSKKSEAYKASLYDLWGSVRSILLLTVSVGAVALIERSVEIEAWFVSVFVFLPVWLAEVAVITVLFFVLEFLRRIVKDYTK